MKLFLFGLIVLASFDSFAADIDNQSNIKCETSQFVDVSASSRIIAEVCWDDSLEDSDDIISEKIISSVKCDLETNCFAK
jgi:hypothetical protein